MQQYVIDVAPVDGEISVTLAGPGIGVEGKHYVFTNMTRTASFIEAVNFAYQQGLRDGRRRARLERDAERLTIISGRTPDTLRTRSETFAERMVRWVSQRLRLD